MAVMRDHPSWLDAELVLHTMIEYPNYEKVVIVSGDGDFHCLIKYLRGKLEYSKP